MNKPHLEGVISVVHIVLFRPRNSFVSVNILTNEYHVGKGT